MKWNESTHVIVNTGARQAERLLDSVVSAVKKAGCTQDRIHVVNQDVFSRTLEEIMQRKPENLIIGGGDGTISAAVSHVLDTNTAIGIIPLGTGNSFARTLGLPLAPVDAVGLLSHAHPKAISIGKVNDKYFLTSASLGLSSHVAASISDAQKGVLGRAAYIISGLRLLFRHKPFSCTLLVEGKEHYIETYQIIVANSRLETLAAVPEDASAFTSTLVYVALGTRRSIWQHAKSSVQFFSGLEQHSADTFVIKSKEPVFIRTSPDQVVDIDGEPLSNTPAVFKVLPRAMSVLLPE